MIVMLLYSTDTLKSNANNDEEMYEQISHSSKKDTSTGQELPGMYNSIIIIKLQVNSVTVKYLQLYFVCMSTVLL